MSNLNFIFLNSMVNNNNCYFNCITKDNGKSYFCNKDNNEDPNSTTSIVTNCSCPSKVQFFRLMRHLNTTNIKIN